MDEDKEFLDDEFLFYSLLYSSITVLFGMAVLSKFLTNEFRFGFRSLLSLVILFIGEPMCHFLLKGPSGLVLFGMGCLFVYSILPASHLPAANKAVLITGCDSGFGHALVKKLDSIGMRVYAGCLYPDGQGAIELTNACSDRLKIVHLDVTNKSQIEKLKQRLEQTLESEGLWGLVNNAGIFYVADLELTSDKIFSRVLEVNLMGTVRVTNAFLPLIRKARGRIVNMSSLTGKLPMECYGAYSVSKHGIEAFSDTLRLEMRKWGVSVSIVQPSGFKTGATDLQLLQSRKEEIWANLDDIKKDTYGKEYLDRLYLNFESTVSKCATDLTPVVRACRSGLLSKRPTERYPCGRGARTVLSIFPILPIWLADKMSIAAHDVKPVGLTT